MSHINHKVAREMLSQACKRYIDHNKKQLAAIDAGEKPWHDDDEERAKGFDIWVHYFYENAQRYIFWLDKTRLMRGREEQFLESMYFEEFNFGQIRSGRHNAPLSNPGVVLHNLTALNRLLHHILANLNKVPEILKMTSEIDYTFTFNTKLSEYRRENQRVYPGAEDTPLGCYQLSNEELSGSDSQTTTIYRHKIIEPKAKLDEYPQQVGLNSSDNDRPVHLLLPYVASQRGQSHSLSIQIYNALQNVSSLFDFINTLQDDHVKENCYGLGLELNGAYPLFEGYLKGIAVRELKATLDDTSLSDEDVIRTVEAQLKNPTTIAILTKNRQSQSEYILKVLSVVSILIGVGIFPTLGLICKRLYDTGGTSINFFKPLSKNLFEDVENITTNTESNDLKI